jgi:protocatechuate 3,4-dioxygenase beta subunit
MPRKLTVGLIALFLVALLALARRCVDGERASPLHSPRAAEVEPPSAPVDEPPVLLAPERVEVAAEPGSASPAPAAPVAAEPAAEPEQPDLAARDWLEIQVLDPEQRPVPEAQLSIAGLRKQGDPGSWYGMRGGPAAARTDAGGRARIDYTRWVDIDGRATHVDLEVTHPEFAPFRDSSFAIGPGQHPVVLRRGATVIVSGWVGSPDVLVTELAISADHRSRLAAGDWRRERDGRLSTTRLAPGPHLIWLEHESEEHGKLASAVAAFELLENDWKELSLELFALSTLQGRLDEAVPRPIVNGHVWVNLNRSDAAGQISIDRDFEAEVRPDGTFELVGLPPGGGQIIALASGWVSSRTPYTAAEAAARRLGREPSFEEVQQEGAREELEAQRLVVPAPAPIVVAMERTGSLEVTVLGPDGGPIAGASVSAWPNVYWIGVGSTIFPWREWRASTDPLGRARIDDLPPEQELWFGAEHGSFRMTRAQRDRNPSVEIVSGQVATYELVLEPSED